MKSTSLPLTRIEFTCTDGFPDSKECRVLNNYPSPLMHAELKKMPSFRHGMRLAQAVNVVHRSCFVAYLTSRAYMVI